MSVDKNKAENIFGPPVAFFDSIQPSLHYDSRLRWGRAANGWYDYPANGSYVDCYPASDFSGVTYDTDRKFRVYLPRCGGCDPNVEAGQTIAYMACDDGVFVAVSGYLDAAVGTIRMWAPNQADPPAGWVECSPGGTAGRPDSTVQALAGRMPVGKLSSDEDFDTVGESGGSKSHKHRFLEDVPFPEPDCWQQILTGDYGQMLYMVEPTETLPPYCVVRFIERYNNSVNN